MAAPGYNAGTGFAGTLQALSSTLISLVTLAGAGSSQKRWYVWEIECAQNAVPNATDCAVEYALNYCSFGAGGTGTSLTPFPTAGALTTDVAVTVAKANFTVEPTTYTQADEFWHDACNQRSRILWQAAPGEEIFSTGAATVGMGLRAKSTNYTGTSIANLKFSEI